MDTIRRRKELQGDLDDLGYEFYHGAITWDEYRKGHAEVENELDELDELDKEEEEDTPAWRHEIDS